MAHLHSVPTFSNDNEAEATQLKQEILNRGGVRVDMKHAREVARLRLIEAEQQAATLRELDAELTSQGRRLSIAPRAVRAERARAILASMDRVVQEDDGEVA